MIPQRCLEQGLRGPVTNLLPFSCKFTLHCLIYTVDLGPLGSLLCLLVRVKQEKGLPLAYPGPNCPGVSLAPKGTPGSSSCSTALFTLNGNN